MPFAAQLNVLENIPSGQANPVEHLIILVAEYEFIVGGEPVANSAWNKVIFAFRSPQSIAKLIKLTRWSTILNHQRYLNEGWVTKN